MAEVFRKVPSVKEVREQGGSGERGADLIVTYESGLPIPELQGQHTCVVQVKSYRDEHWDTHAVEQIREALRHWDADAGLIVSTASSRTTALDDALDQLREETEKPVGLLIGEDLAAFVLRFGGDLLI
ncbi:MAG: restriction endonuclease [Gemmatimonadota bacterium]|nr:restriction endonuclease [Gemmatimonadota bacterium]